MWAGEDMGKQPFDVKNLADFRRLIKPGTEIKATSHRNHPDIVGLTRVITEVQTNAFYSKIKDQPEHKFSTCNYGKGFRTDIEKASDYIFDSTTVKVLNRRAKDGSVLYEMQVFSGENSMAETNEAAKVDVNDDPVLGM